MPSQLLLTAEHFYLLAPAGQVVEGFLCILTHACRDEPTRLRCIDDIPERWADELASLVAIVSRFYGDTYRAPPLLYEHGRGGGSQSSLPGGDFVFHPHICALPGDLELHPVLQERFQCRAAPAFPRLRASIGRRPYLYVHTPGRAGCPDPVVYYGGELDSDEHLGGLSLKRMVVEANALDREVDWRRYPGEQELAALVANFNRWYAEAYRRPTDPRWTLV